MAEQPKLLVVDDEEAICEGCRRIFTRQGYDVDKSNLPLEGLQRATTGDYAAILLDIKMPEMSGLDFLSHLRTAQRDTPVILMTGYPSVPTAISAVQLGAAGYVMKPFTPEEITQAVHQFVPRDRVEVAAEPAQPAAGAEGSSPLFWHESWLRHQRADEYRVGAMPAGLDAEQVQQVRVPSIGQVVYQGLPLAEIVLADGSRRVVPSPLTGVVEAVNDAYAGADVAALLEAGVSDRGWIAEVCATRAEDELKNCAARRVLVVSPDAERAAAQRQRLEVFGCEVSVYSGPVPGAGWEEIARLLAHRGGMVVLDAAALGDEGPWLAGQIAVAVPATKVMVVDSPDCPAEKAYRAHKILYYTADPMADHELRDVLDCAFRIPVAPRGKSVSGDESVASIQITNRKGSRVMLIAAPGVLRRNTGLGAEIRGLLYDRLYPIQTLPGLARVAPRDVLNAAQHCDRVVVLLARDAGQIPGALVRDAGSELATLTDADAGKVTTLVIQPPGEEPVDRLDSRTLIQLARHVVEVMSTT